MCQVHFIQSKYAICEAAKELSIADSIYRCGNQGPVKYPAGGRMASKEQRRLTPDSDSNSKFFFSPTIKEALTNKPRPSDAGLLLSCLVAPKCLPSLLCSRVSARYPCIHQAQHRAQYGSAAVYTLTD